jgi:hypothetical protein
MDCLAPRCYGLVALTHGQQDHVVGKVLSITLVWHSVGVGLETGFLFRFPRTHTLVQRLW